MSTKRDQLLAIIDSLPDEELRRIFFIAEIVQNNYRFRQNLLSKGVRIYEPEPEEESAIIHSWDTAFAGHLSEGIKSSIYYENYKWQIFSEKKQDCLHGEEARRAFDALPKAELLVMYESPLSIYRYDNTQKVDSADFDSESDIYLFDRTFSWTYVHTHEEYIGPYFCQLQE